MRQLAWNYPEWWVLSLAACAWLVLVAAARSSAHPHVTTSLTMHMVHWQLMVMGMMAPLIIPSLRFVAFRSLWRRRHRAVAAFLLGYSAVWALAGGASGALLRWVPALALGEGVAAALLIGALWQWSPLKQRALVACHRTRPLSPRGLGADRDCILFGWQSGTWCCINCWPLMLACALSGHHPVALLACGTIGIVERYAWRANTRALSLCTFASGVAFL